MNDVKPAEWAAAVRLAIRQEDLYAEIDEIDQINPLLLPTEDNESPMDIDIANEESDTETKPPKKCEHCDFETNLDHVFQRHKNSVRHCDMCTEVFCGERSLRTFKSHQKTHDFKPKRAHICIHCNKPFQYASRLQHHLVRSKCGRL